MKISILKADKGDFNFSSGIISINRKNAIEGKREAKKTIFLIVSQAYQRYQDEKSYPLHITRQKLQILQKEPYPLFTFNFSISFCILPDLFKLNKKPYNENRNEIASILSAIGLSSLKNAKKLPLNPADHKIILSFIIEYSAFNVSNFSFKASKLFIITLYRADLFFYIVNDFGFLVILKPSFSPFWDFIFIFPTNRYAFMIKTAHIGEFFYRQVAFFKCLFKFIISHRKPLKLIILAIISKKYNLIN